MEEFRVIGPPGCGKTTWLVRHIQKAIESSGRNSVLVASLTKAAAREVSDRGLGLPKGAIGTLHSHAYHALGNPDLATGTKLKSWNDTHARFALPGSDRDWDDGIETLSRVTSGEDLMLKYSSLRSRQIARELWPATVRYFADLWERWKADTGFIDFTDLIEKALEQTDHAPGNPAFIFLDEAQDMDRLQLALVRHWARRCVRLLIVGDPYQNLYEWRGTDPESFFDPPVDDDHLKVLRDSWRVPRAVHRVAEKWIRRHPAYKHFEYRPRDADGSVEELWCPMDYPEEIVRDIQSVIAQGKRAMVLAACGYMLTPLIGALKARLIPFWNPYRTKKGDWNPLAKPERVLSYLAAPERLWTWKELHAWTRGLAADGILRRGAKKTIKENSKSREEVTSAEIMELFEPGACEVGDLDWLESHQLNTSPKSTKYLIGIARAHGKNGLLEQPLVVVGTIHSVKGGEADVVYLFPNLSTQGMRAWTATGSRGYGSVVRQFYVGITRAKERLVICRQADPRCVEIAV